MMRPLATLIVLASGVLFTPTRGLAQSALTVRSLEYGSWAETVATLQADLHAQGRSVHVVVQDARGALAECGTYQLSIDPNGARAFGDVGCDARSRATELRLIDRSALFELGGPVARPRRITISALEFRAGSSEGGAAQPVEPELSCSVSLRPMLVDLYTGQRVLATPDRYELRPVGSGVRAVVREDRWSIRSGAVEVEYELIDRTTGESVLHDTIQLTCGGPTATVTPGYDRSADVIELHPDRVFRGATLTRGPDDSGSCGGQEGPEQWYVMRLSDPVRLGLRLVSEFDATLYVRRGSIDGPEVVCRDRSARLETVEMTLEAGTYYVAVDGTGTHGRFRLVAFEGPADPNALQRGPRGQVSPHQWFNDELVPTSSHAHASCGGELAPEHVYTMLVQEPARVWVRLTSHFDSVLYVRHPGGQEMGCRRTLGYPHDVRSARVAMSLAPGEYQVFVDAAHASDHTGRYRLTMAELPLTAR